jgi:hypothetical protein
MTLAKSLAFHRDLAAERLKADVHGWTDVKADELAAIIASHDRLVAALQYQRFAWAELAKSNHTMSAAVKELAKAQVEHLATLDEGEAE